jgi:hypothetical protein
MALDFGLFGPSLAGARGLPYEQSECPRRTPVRDSAPAPSGKIQQIASKPRPLAGAFESLPLAPTISPGRDQSRTCRSILMTCRHDLGGRRRNTVASTLYGAIPDG